MDSEAAAPTLPSARPGWLQGVDAGHVAQKRVACVLNIPTTHLHYVKRAPQLANRLLPPSRSVSLAASASLRLHLRLRLRIRLHLSA